MPSDITRDIASLPLEAQREVRDFVEFLKQKHGTPSSAEKPRSRKLADEPFVGMWKDRPEMSDAVEWVRRLRVSEWERRS